MATSHDTAGIYADFSRFAGMRAEARRGEDGSTERVARKFESIFVQMMLKSMRDATPDSGLFGGSMRTYQDMFDRQMSLELTAERGIGLAEMIVRQLGARSDDGSDAGSLMGLPAPIPASMAHLGSPYASDTSEGLGRGITRVMTESVSRAVGQVMRDALAEAARDVVSPGSPAAPPATAVAGGAAVKRSAFHSPEEFVKGLLPHARDAGAALGVDPKVLLAQAALETGWGRHVMTDRDGLSANNFFGIKADARWDGSRVRVSTLESLGGVLEQVRADFRAYESPADGFRDYVEFISGHGRYAPALDAAADPVAYVHGLQTAGYATDPRYAEKILAIVRRSEFNEMVRVRDGAEILKEVF